MKVYVTRHGETEYSLKNLVCGSTDCPVTDKGREQALQLANHIKHQKIRIDVIYTSPLIRAKETAEIISDAISVPCVTDARLREQSCGTYEGNVSRDDAAFNVIRRNFANRFGGGDSILQLAQRIYNFLDEVCAGNPERNILLVAHTCACNMINSYFNEITNEEYFNYKLGNCALDEFEII